MKTIFIVIITSILTLNSGAQNTDSWEVLNEGEGSFGLIDFVSDDVGFMVADGNLIQTVDGGDTWNFLSQNTGGIVFTIDFTSEYNGWALCRTEDNHQILKSNDGGHTWQIKKETTDHNFRSIHVVSDSVVFVVFITGSSTITGPSAVVFVVPRSSVALNLKYQNAPPPSAHV